MSLSQKRTSSIWFFLSFLAFHLIRTFLHIATNHFLFVSPSAPSASTFCQSTPSSRAVCCAHLLSHFHVMVSPHSSPTYNPHPRTIIYICRDHFPRSSQAHFAIRYRYPDKSNSKCRHSHWQSIGQQQQHQLHLLSRRHILQCVKVHCHRSDSDKSHHHQVSSVAGSLLAEDRDGKCDAIGSKGQPVCTTPTDWCSALYISLIGRLIKL